MKKIKYYFLAIFLIVFHLACNPTDNIPEVDNGEKPQEKPKDNPKDEPKDNPKGEVFPIGSLIFDSGAFARHKSDTLKAFEINRGAKVDVIAVFPTRSSWPNLHNSWFMGSGCIPADFKGTLNIGMPLYPENGNLDDAANGNYNSEWEKFGKMVAAKYPTAYIRVGWEMNINDWYYKATPENKEKWIAAYRHAVTSLRKASSTFRFIFNPNFGDGQTGTKDATDFYPGDDYVDLIGIDAYDWYPAYTTDANINFQRTKNYGWDWWLNFAKSRNKKFCVPEWGLHKDGGKDNPKYIDFVYSWLKENKEWVAMECYFHTGESYIRSDLFTGFNPTASAAYKKWMPLLKK